MLKEKVCVVTGSGAGIGRGIALEFAKAGGIVIVATRSQGDGEAVAKEIIENNGQAEYIKLDVSQETEIISMVDYVIEKYHKIDVLVNNAGITEFNPMAEVEQEDWYRVLDIDLKGVFLCSKHVSAHMKKAQQGSIINISTNHVASTIIDSEVYTAAKGGVSAMTRSMALSLGKDNIRVNAICPGFTDTPHHHTWMENRKGSYAEAEEAVLGLHAINRICRPEDIAYLAIYLGSDYSECMTGSNLLLDGGLSISLFKSDILEAKEE